MLIGEFADLPRCMIDAMKEPAAPKPRTDRSPLSPPDSVELLLDFVNTRADSGGRPESLGNAEGLRQWVRKNGLADDDTAPTSADAASARELRDALVTVMLAHAGADVCTKGALALAESHLRRRAALHPLVSVITAAGAELTSAQTGIPRVFGTILATVTEFARLGNWSRLKACRNPVCHLGFFDRTRNSSALYCSSGCSSQVSMRAYRQRRKQR
jgi:predicted RNA-binding Zn ribbon-like protein